MRWVGQGLVAALMALVGVAALGQTSAPATGPVPSSRPATDMAPVAAAAPAQVDSYRREVVMGWSELASTDAIPVSEILMLGDGHWEVPGKLAPKILGVELSALPKDAFELWGAVRGREATIGIACTMDLDQTRAGVRPAARQFVDAIAQEIPAFIRQAQMQQADRAIAPQAEEMKRATLVLAQAKAENEQLREQIRKATGRDYIDAASIRQWAAAVENERQTLTLELSGMVQRRGVVTKQLAELTRKVEQAVETDTSLQELQNVVKLRSAAVERAKAAADQGRGSMGDVDAAQIALGEAQVRLATERRAVAQAAGADRIGVLTSERSQLDAREVEIDGRLDQITQKRAGLAGLDAALDRLEQLKPTTQRASPDQAMAELSKRFLTPPLWITVREK